MLKKYLLKILTAIIILPVLIASQSFAQEAREIVYVCPPCGQKAQIVLSVCNGAFILAKAGLLNGLQATATRPLVHGLTSAAPNITIVEDTRFVDNGKVITSGGLSAGMDAALHVVARIKGEQTAERVAKGIEYEWNSEGVISNK